MIMDYINAPNKVLFLQADLGMYRFDRIIMFQIKERDATNVSPIKGLVHLIISKKIL